MLSDAALAPLSRADVAACILRLPPIERLQATAYYAQLVDPARRKGTRSRAARRPEDRRRYAGDPWAYFADILGWSLTRQQEEALALIERSTRVLLPSGNNQGKTFLLSGYGIYVFDAVAALENPDTGEREQGARVLLPGPSADTVFETLYSEMLTHAARAESRGHLMPGERSEKSVLWRVRPKWHVEAFSPAERVDQNVAHTASGRHHRNQIALIEEGQGVAEAVWKAAEGMCSSAGNKIISSFNPTEPKGPAFARARSGAYRVYHLSAFQHPNVLERRSVIPDAVDVSVIDARVRTDCRDRGPASETPVEPEHGDFLYALPPRESEDVGAPRPDGHLGHDAGQLRVYRPNGAFTAQVLGEWPKSSESGLFGTAELEQSVQRWLASPAPTAAPDRVGLDPAREGVDETTAAPAWGESAEALLRLHAEAEKRGEGVLASIRAERRVRVGELAVFPKGKGPETAQRVAQRFPRSPFTVDMGGVGSSPGDYLEHVLRRQVLDVSFAETPRPRVTDAEPFCANMRTQLYVRTAMLVARGLADLPDDDLLREELLAHELEHTTITAEVWEKRGGRDVKVKKRVPAVALISKDEVKKRIGRSPDRADATVLSLHDAPRRRGTSSMVPASESSFTI